MEGGRGAEGTATGPTSPDVTGGGVGGRGNSGKSQLQGGEERRRECRCDGRLTVAPTSRAGRRSGRSGRLALSASTALAGNVEVGGWGLLLLLLLLLMVVVLAETLYHRDDALLYIAYVMLIWAAPIPADRWHCSLWP